MMTCCGPIAVWVCIAYQFSEVNDAAKHVAQTIEILDYLEKFIS